MTLHMLQVLPEHIVEIIMRKVLLKTKIKICIVHNTMHNGFTLHIQASTSFDFAHVC